MWRLGDEQLEPLLHAAVPSLQEAYRILSLWESQRGVVNEGASSESPVSVSQDLWNILFQRLTYLRGAQNELRNTTYAHLLRLEGLVSQGIQ